MARASPFGTPHAALVLDLGARFAPQPDRLRVAADLEPDLLEQLVGVPLDGVQLLLGQHLVRRNRRA